MSAPTRDKVAHAKDALTDAPVMRLKSLIADFGDWRKNSILAGVSGEVVRECTDSAVVNGLVYTTVSYLMNIMKWDRDRIVDVGMMFGEVYDSIQADPETDPEDVN